MKIILIMLSIVCATTTPVDSLAEIKNHIGSTSLSNETTFHNVGGYFFMTYWSEKCDYDVYISQKTGTTYCNEWIHLGTVRPRQSVTVRVYAGKFAMVRVVHSGGRVCEVSHRKREDFFEVPKSSSEKSHISYELDDYHCGY